MSAFANTSTSPTPSAPAPALRLLGELRTGEAGRVAEVAVETSDASRLKALGVCAGRTVRVVSAGNPLIVQVLNSRVGLSAELAARVTLSTC
ncbi:FeoA domain protein [Posidoniimonas corsicana]|uniref:FeoA domain protein n=1 Tax=Posidoniimonas corsicana TaxID=1938618 RepID=A0A5C5VJI7_9BACT|nr:FeoA family protein [Posidoniimonas corsicana]TWT38241.1 FeoA domain protein [Posidoniimonas corsicana]